MRLKFQKRKNTMDSKPLKVALIAMGCEKNIINSEQMLALLNQAGMQLIGDPAEADVTVINTCGFIESARQEAIEQIEEIAEMDCKIIVAGCMAERSKTALSSGSGGRNQQAMYPLSLAHGYVGTGRFDDIVSAVRSVMEGQTPLYYGGLDEPVSESPRLHTGPSHTAYIKVAEGCDNHCAYCAIPSLRGSYRSRRIEAILEEARTLCRQGVKELIVVAQDVTRYGLDLYGDARLPELLNQLCEVPGLHRLRLHYLYPELITDNLIETIAVQPKIARYLDIPMQHASDRILAAMNRRYTRSDLEHLISKLRERIPGIVLRTSIIVGFPGEEREDFDSLTAFLQWAKIPRVGVFTYSREEGTPAAAMPNQVSEAIKKRLKSSVERLQSRIIDDFNKQREGTVAEVLCEGYDRYAGVYYGRSEAESPDVDGVVFFTAEQKVQSGEFVSVLLTGSFEGDAMGELFSQ